jgi:hypothetical protein
MLNQMKKHLYFALIGLALSACGEAEVPENIAKLEAGLPEKIDYNQHIKPLLSDRCFKCHGPDANKREAGLRLDLADEAYAEQKSGKVAITPNDLDNSEVFHRIISKDHDLMMPTPESNLSLADEEKALLVKWIRQGAEYKEHWSFSTIEKPDVPEAKDKNWVKNEIDNFVLAKLDEKKLPHSTEADKTTLAHRLAMDLIGLPPTVAEVDAFLKDNSENAYEKLVDRLLTSPHFGERMAVEWLDVARYADSHGYQDDGMRNSFPYRDWVINAFNKNLRFNDFITWQLAGDMLPNPTKDMLVATHFNRNHPQTQEGGVVDEEYRTEYVIDRVGTFGKAFLAMSFECARCHDHKYDPVSQKEFYQVYAFFNNNNESGIIPYNGEASPTVMLTSAEVEKQVSFINQKLKPVEKALTPEVYRPKFERWLSGASKNPTVYGKPKHWTIKQRINPGFVVAAAKDPQNQDKQKRLIPSAKFISDTESGLVAHFGFENFIYPNSTPPTPKPNEKPEPAHNLVNNAGTSMYGYAQGDYDRLPQIIKGRFGNAMKLIGDCGLEFGREADFERNQAFSVSLWVNLLKKGESGPLFQKANGEFEGHRGYRVWLNEDGTLMINFSYVWPSNCIDIRTLDKIQVGQWSNVTLTYDGSSKASGLKIFLNGKEMSHKVLTDNLHKSILYGEKKSHWDQWVDAPFAIGKEFRTTMSDIAFDDLKIYARQLSNLEIQDIVSPQKTTSATSLLAKKELDDKEKEALFEYYLLTQDQTFRNTFDHASVLRERANQLITDQPEVMAMSELQEPRKTFVLNRGQYDQPTKEQVFPSTPEKLLSYSSSFPKNRLGLAQWLLHDDNPLFARVMVNRFWATVFGKGIVATSDDFGNQGNLPTHPELLDWLASDFKENGWDVKAIIKKMVMSATYRQRSVASPKAIETDAENLWFSHAPTYRYSHEQIRDKILAGSGLLNRKIGGPSVYPYQPAGLWEALATRNVTSYKQNHGDSLYRRGLYTIWKRSSPPPSAITFDASERYFCIVKRQKTSTPLQSLVLMNDPQYLEAARILAENAMVNAQTLDQRIMYMYKSLLSRNPSKEELTIFQKYQQQEFLELSKDKQKAQKLISIGEYPINKALNQTELASYALVATTLMNFDETVMKR